MKIQLECREPGCTALIEYRPVGNQHEEPLNCPQCARRYQIRRADALCRGELLERCAICDGEELFIRKDFPQKTGLAIVLLAGLISFWALERNTGLAYGVLAAALLVDAIIYYLIGVVTVCYRCRSEYWGVSRNKKHAWFDLAVSDKYL